MNAAGAEPARPPGKIGPNNPCWCGSGRKYKKCHRADDEEHDRRWRAGQPERARSRCRHGGQRCYPYLPSAGGDRAAGRLAFGEAIRRTVHSGAPVFHYFAAEDLGSTPQDYQRAIDKLQSYGITPYLDGDPSAGEVEMGQRWLDCLFGPVAYTLHASGDRFEAARHAAWLEGCAPDGVSVYWGWDPAFARVVAQIVEWRWDWRCSGPEPGKRRRAHCGGTLLGLARAVRLALDHRRELDALREALLERAVEAAELWSVSAFVAETLLAAVELEAPARLSADRPADGLQFPAFLLGVALGAECAAGPEAIVERYGFEGAMADAVREALRDVSQRPELRESLERLASELEQGPPAADAFLSAPLAAGAPQATADTADPPPQVRSRKRPPDPSPAGAETAHSRQTSPERVPAAAPPAPAPLHVAATEVWAPLRGVSDSFVAQQVEIDQRLGELDERRRSLQAQLADIDDQAAAIRGQRQKLPLQEALAAGAALAAVLDESAAHFPSGRWRLALSARLEAGNWTVGCALPLAGHDPATCSPDDPGWQLAGAAVLGLRGWAAEQSGVLDHAQLRHELAGRWSVLWLELPMRLVHGAAGSATADGPGRAVAGALADHFGEARTPAIEVGMVSDDVLRQALTAARDRAQERNGHALEHPAIGIPTYTWLADACRQLSLSPLAIVAHLALLGLPPEAAGPDGLAGVAQRLGRPFQAEIGGLPDVPRQALAYGPGALHSRRGVRLTRNVAPDEAIKALARAGWVHDRTSGDHAILEKAGCATKISLPVARHHLAPGRLLGLIKEAGLSEQEFLALL